MMQANKGRQHRITKIEKQKRKGRYNIYLDGAFVFGLAEDVILKNHLHGGDTITDEIIQKIQLQEETHQAKQKTIVLLKYRSRSIKEVRDRLYQKGFKQNVIDSVIHDFTQIGLLDDKQFAGIFTRSRLIQKPMAKRLLLRELRLKGIPEQEASRAVEEAYMEVSEESMARRLCEKRLRRFNSNDLKTKKKLYDFLKRRGFSWDVIERVFKDLKVL